MVDMNVEQLIKAANLNPIATPCPNREIMVAYIGDLLSWVMGKAESGNVWITIMSNINTVAVATLADVGCILLAEDVMPDDNALQAAMDKGVNILSVSMSAYETALKTSELLN